MIQNLDERCNRQGSGLLLCLKKQYAKGRSLLAAWSRSRTFAIVKAGERGWLCRGLLCLAAIDEIKTILRNTR